MAVVEPAPEEVKVVSQDGAVVVQVVPPSVENVVVHGTVELSPDLLSVL